MSPKYKLTYFDGKALAEPIRFLFAYANVEYVDVRIVLDDWPNVKSQMPWGVLPLLEEDGKQLSQSVTIVRYLGRKFGLAGADEFQTAKCNEYIDALVDVRLEVTKNYKETDEAKKAEGKKKIQEITFPTICSKFNEILKKNETGFLVGDKMTYADIYIGVFIEWLALLLEMTDSVKDLRELYVHQTTVLTAPGIKEWIDKRPVTEF